MPITLPETLPAFDVLRNEGVMVMSPDRAAHQDIRPLRIGLLNLMPKKIQTENQFARLIGATPLQIDLHLIRMSEHQTKNTAAEHMETFYRPFQEVRGEKFDGLIITGAPIEHLPFEEVTYWDELCEVMDWTQTNVHSTFGVCWGGMAMINHFHGVKKHMLERQGLRLLPPPATLPDLALSARLLGRFRHPGQPLDRDEAARDRRAPGLRTLLGRTRSAPAWSRTRPPRALHLQPFRI
jgi:homoserine O-succinyltransferase